MKYPLLSFLLLWACASWPQAQEQILLIGDDVSGESFSLVRRAGARALAERRARLSEESRRGTTVADLLEQFERRVDRQNPTTVLLALGAHDVWDFRASEATDTTVETVVAGLADAVSRLKATEAVVILATPPAFGEDAPELRAAMEPLAQAIRALAESSGCALLDIHELTAEDGSYRRGGQRLEREALERVAEAVMARLGLAGVSLPPLAPHDRVVLFTDGQFVEHITKPGSPLVTAFQAQFGTDRELVAVLKPLHSMASEDGVIVNQRPRALLICAGHRAITQNQAVEAFQAEYRQVIAVAREAGIAPIILLTPLPVGPSEGALDPRADEAQHSRLIAQAVSGLGQELGLPVIDLQADAWRHHTANPEANYFPQRCSAVGREVVMETLRTAFGLEPW